VKDDKPFKTLILFQNTGISSLATTYLLILFY
jgi:hypothetical protein